MTRLFKKCCQAPAGMGRIAVGLLVCLLTGAAVADDTEIYLTSYAAAGQPNILFVLDSSGSMNDGLTLSGDGQVGKSKYLLMREVLEDVLATIPDTVNVGLLNYGGHKEKAQANGIRYPVSPLSVENADGKTAPVDTRKAILDEIDKFKVEGVTPLVQSLYEAAVYFRGEDVYYGASGPKEKLANPLALTQSGTNKGMVCVDDLSKDKQFYCQVGADVGCGEESPRPNCELIEQKGDEFYYPCLEEDEAGNCLRRSDILKKVDPHKSWFCPVQTCTVSGRYKSPIQNECQPSYIVLMSDGEPDDGYSTKSIAPDPYDHDPVIVERLKDDLGVSGCDESLGDGRCGPKLTQYLANIDQRPDIEGKQTVSTFTIAFALDGKGGEQYLEKLANLGEEAEARGEKGAFVANNTQQLKEVFNQIVTNIAVVNHDLAIPSISVDPETGLTHGDEVFFPFFRPGISPRWPGNLKKYKLEREEGALSIVDANGVPIYDEAGNPVQGTHSFWLPAGDPADGGDIASGGAARLLGAGRSIFTSNDSDALIELNADSVEADWFGGGDVAELVDYARGIDTTVAAGELKYRQEMGDILHSAPVLVSYEDGPDLIFVATNEGYLHAIDTATGVEKFAFIPKALLPVIKIRKDNDLNAPHPYGLDGYMTVWRDDTAVAAGDKPTGKTFLIVGMRRGGLNYYALDITDPDKPELAWVIRGGASEFASLGQTWSRVFPAVVQLGEKPQPVFIFSGGYDPEYDQPDPQHRFAEKIRGGAGNTLFIVDARTGEKVTQVELGEDSASIPANPRIIDIDNNGIADRVYLVDIEGHIFRIDLPDPGNALMAETEQVSKPRVVMLADLGSTSLGVPRRFYNEPDAALVVQDGIRFITLSLGSGYRAHPLMKDGDIDQDYLFVVKDRHVYQLPLQKTDNSYHLIVPDDLADISNLNAGQSAPETEPQPSQYGWKLALNKKGGEKALAKAVTLKNTVYFTTFEPETKPAADVCSNASHTGRVYGLDVRTGKSALKFADIDEPKQSFEYTTSDIPSEVVLVASRYEKNIAGSKVVKGVKFDILDSKLKGLESPTFSGLNKWYWEVAK